MSKRKEIFVKDEDLNLQKDILRQIKTNFSDELLIKRGFNPSYYLITYGCAMNERDSETIEGMLEQAGFEPASCQEDADLILFNTCCVRDHAELKVYGNVGALSKLKAAKPELLIGVCGCMMQQEEVANHLFKNYKFVDMVFGTHSLYLFPQSLQNAIEGNRVLSVLESDGVIAENQPALRKKDYSASININFGCNNFCTYCVVPYVRGRERSRHSKDIIDEIKALADNGTIEVTLLGQNVNSYNNDSDEDVTFYKLLQKIEKIEGIKRIRFMTSHPKDISDDLIKVIAESEKICNHIHLPMQSGSNRILKLMNRGYTREAYLEKLYKAKELIKDVQITSDFIVGFPTETQEDFEQTLDIIKKCEFASVFSFLYSPRKNTPAEKMPDQIPLEIKKERIYALNELQREISIKQNDRFLNNVYEVLVEGKSAKVENMLIGKTTNSRVINFYSDKDLIGTMTKVKVVDTKQTSLIGERVN